MATAQVRRRDAGLQEKDRAGSKSQTRYRAPGPPPPGRRPAVSAAPGPLSARRPREPRVPLPLRRCPPRARCALTRRRDQVPKPPGERRSAGDSAVGRAEMQAQKAPDSRSRPVPSNGNTLGPAPAPVPPRSHPAPPRPGRPQCACVRVLPV